MNAGGRHQRQPPPQGILPTDNSRPHTLAGAFSRDLPGRLAAGHGAGQRPAQRRLFATFRYTSGTAYTKCGVSSDENSVLSIENCDRLFPEGLNAQRLPAFKQLDARFTKCFGLGGLDLTGYLDVRNLLNFKNILEVFAANGDIRNDAERGAPSTPISTTSPRSANVNVLRRRLGRGERIDLTFGGRGVPAGCGNWVSSKDGAPAAPNCVYLIRAEERFGNGDHIFTVAEQTARSTRSTTSGRGEHFHTAPRPAGAARASRSTSDPGLPTPGPDRSGGAGTGTEGPRFSQGGRNASLALSAHGDAGGRWRWRWR